MAVIAAIAISAGISAVVQAYVQHQAQKGSKNELKEIKKAFDALVPPEYDINIDDPPELIAQKTRSIDYDFSRMTPEQYKVVGKYAPETVPYIEEQNPELIRDSAIGKEGLSAQQNALQKLREVSEGGIDPQFAQRMKEAADRSQMEAQSRQESILQDYGRKGLLGSGTGLAAQLSGAEGAMQRGSQQSSDAATQAYLNQLGALRQSGELGGQMRGQELDLAARNAQIANSFNERTTGAYQNYLQNIANQRNDAALKNLATQQGVENLNVGERNASAIRERDRSDILKEKLREQSIANTANKNMINQQNWENKIKQKQIEDGIKQQQFSNQIQKTTGSTGANQAMAQNIMQTGQQNANIASGLGSAAQTGILSYAEMKQKDDEKEARRKRDDYLYPGMYD